MPKYSTYVCVLEYLASGMSEDEILADFPDLEHDSAGAITRRVPTFPLIPGSSPGQALIFSRQGRRDL